MKRTFLPFFVWPCVTLNQKTIFHKVDEKVTVEAPGKLIRQLVEVCGGTRSLDEIVQLLKNEWDEHSVRDLIEELRQVGVLVDSRYLSDVIWKVVKNPSYFPASINGNKLTLLVDQAKERHRSQSSNKVYQVLPSSFTSLLNRRRSVRSFSDKPVELQSIINMLWSAYGEVYVSKSDEGDKNLAIDYHRTVPSAGALYPLMIHIALFKDTAELSPGVYRVWMGSPGAVGFSLVSKDTSRFIRAFVDPLMISKSHGVIVISGSFHITSQKYRNRSILYVTLEAGYAAQNIHLSALEAEVATVEVGGFVDELLAEAIELSGRYHPLTIVVFGEESKEFVADSVKTDCIETQWVTPMANQYRPLFTIALARVSDETNRSWSEGKSISPCLAHIKAIAEAREWAACGCIPNMLTRAQFINMATAIDPRTIIRFHRTQYRLKGFPFTPFDEQREYAWVEGKDELTGSAVYILADHVYFPYHPTTPFYTYANSSGVAAHPNRQKAVERATLELIERDAFMIAYLDKLVLPTVSEKTLPQGIQKRVRDLRKIGFRVWIKDYSLDLAPVVFIFAQNKEITCTKCASCASFDVEHAIDHALMEVEVSVLARLQKGPPAFRQPHEVIMPADHGALYGQKPFFRRADFLIQRRNIVSFRDTGLNVAHSWQELLDRFAEKNWRLLTVPLFLSKEYGGNGGLHIIRSIVPGMVPMTFGYRQEPAGMERIYTIAKRFGNREISYQDITKFPHPFA